VQATRFDPRKCPKPTVVIIVGAIVLHGMKLKKKNHHVDLLGQTSSSRFQLHHEIKSLNYLNSILAKIEANTADWMKLFVLIRTVFVSEGVGENIFIVKNGRILLLYLQWCTSRNNCQVGAKNCEQARFEVVESNVRPTNFSTLTRLLHRNSCGNSAN